MKEKNREILNRGIEFLKCLNFKMDDIMVTGSAALDMIGLLPEDREIHDLDFIIDMNKDQLNCLKCIECLNMRSTGKSYEETNTNQVRIDIGGLMLDIWKYDGGDWSDLKDAETGVRVAKANHVISLKKRFAREKDFIDINNIAKSILAI